jgi:hypothetical protein
VVKKLYEQYIVDVECTIKADPPVDVIRWTWSNEVKKEMEDGEVETFLHNRTLLPGEERGRYMHETKPGVSIKIVDIYMFFFFFF